MQRIRIDPIVWTCFLSLFLTANGRADDARLGNEIFERHVRPTLIEHCIRCHGPDKQQAGLRLDTAAGLRAGGDTGLAVAAGDPESSLLVQAIRYDNVTLEMPPRGKLSDDTIAAFERWIRLGAVDPRGEMAENVLSSGIEPPSLESGRTFWAFQPLRSPPIPHIENDDWSLSAIDAFVLDSLEDHACKPNLDADRQTFLRRVTYDLTGLPPTREQILEFGDDDSPDAFERLVDRLLSSDAFAVRWGRHWLDVVRYAESSGGGRTLLFPDAWRYRDFVVESFGQDLPYDQFLRLQLAGDMIPETDLEKRRRNLVATGFLLLGPTNFELQDKDILEMDVVDEQLDTIGKAMLGMTIGCARCHDHKFDPIPTADYYAMAGIFKSTHSMIHSNVSKWNTVPLPLPADEEANYAAMESAVNACKAQIAELTEAIKVAGGQTRKSAGASVDAASLSGVVIDDTAAVRTGQWKESTSIAKYVGDHYIHDETSDKGEKQVRYETRLPEAGRYEVRLSHSAGSNRSTRVPVLVRHADGETRVQVNQRKRPPIDGLFTKVGEFRFRSDQTARITISNEGTQDGVVIADAVVLIPVGEIAEAGNPVARSTELEGDRSATKLAKEQRLKEQRLKEQRGELDRLNKQLKSLQASAAKRPVAMATRDQEQPSDIPISLRGVVANKGEIVPRGALRVLSSARFPSIDQTTSGRIEFASWVTDRDQPLTARVMANRVWYWLVGRGLVETVDNFGSTGQPPTHPELLDYLARSLVDNGWSVKRLVREIVLSRTYRLGSSTANASHGVDPENHWLWRANRKRMRAEAIRDTLLLVSGELDRSVGGPTIKSGTSIEYGYQFDGVRRSVYLPVFRNTLPEIFEAFDFADPNIQQGQRNASTIAPQALLMMNHPFVLERAAEAANQRGATATGGGAGDVKNPRLENRLQEVFLEVLGRSASSDELDVFVEFLRTTGEPEPTGSADSSTRWSLVYQTLFQCVDFRYIH